MKIKKQEAQWDIFTPFYMIFHDLCVAVYELVKELGKFTFSRLFNLDSDLTKIESKSAKVKKATVREESLGVDTKTKRDILLKDIDFRRHTFIVGASGFGKTNLISILQEHSLKQDRPIIFFDPKGDIEALTTFKSLCEKHNRPCYIFSEHYPESISLNPVLEGSVNQIVDRIMRSFEWSEQFYRDSSRRGLTKAVNFLKNSDAPVTLQGIYDQLLLIEDKNNVGIISKLEAIITSDFGKILNATKDGLTLSKVREERASLYIGLSTQGYGETAMAIGKLFLGELLYNSYKSLTTSDEENRGIKNPISVYFDEFGSLVTPEFIELQNKCRGAGIELTLAVQTSSDIDRINPDLTKQIIENSGNIFILKQRLQDGASLFSEAIGTVLAKKQTYKIEDGRQQSAGTERDVHELLVHPDIIKNLRIGQCVLLRQGPTKINLINIRERVAKAVKKYQVIRGEIQESF